MFKWLFFYIKNLIKKGMMKMAEVIYGKKIKAISILWVQGLLDGMFENGFDDVPKLLKPEVAYYLVYLGFEDLITDETIKQQAIDEYNTNKTNSAE